MALKYLGWDGEGPRTLQGVADEYSLTRERVRQVTARVVSSLRGKRPFAPALDEALRFVADRTPGTATDLEAALSAEGLTERRFDLSVLPATAAALGRPPSFLVVRQPGQVLTVCAESGDLVGDIVREARRAVEHWGAATVEDLARRVQGRASSAFVAAVLASRPDLEWLDRESGWFWLRSVQRNRLRNEVEKILAVAGRIEIGDLRAGVERHHRTNGFVPPPRVLLEFCRQRWDCRIAAGAVACDPPPRVDEALSETEQIMYRVLQEHGPVMQRSHFEERCRARGMLRSTFYAHLDSSPILTRYARGIYGLRGTPVPPDGVRS